MIMPVLNALHADLSGRERLGDSVAGKIKSQLEKRVTLKRAKLYSFMSFFNPQAVKTNTWYPRWFDGLAQAGCKAEPAVRLQ